MIHAKNIAVCVTLQRYVDAPPVAVRQRDLVEALAASTHARVFALSCEANLGLVAQAETVEQKLAAYVAPLLRAGISVEHRVLRGRPADALPSVITAAGADLAIIGSHSKRSSVDVDLGSTASALVRALSCPVILVRPTREDEERTLQMMIPHYPRIFAYV